MEALKDQKTKKSIKSSEINELSKTMQEASDPFNRADINQLVLQSSRATCKTAELVLGCKSSGDKPRITQEIIGISNEK